MANILFDQQNPYGQQQPYYPSSSSVPNAPNLQFYSSDSAGYNAYNHRPSLEGNVGSGAGVGGIGGQTYGRIEGPWWYAFGTGGLEGEPPLLEELGINFSHIRDKSLTVLNPLQRVDARIMDDADLAGPLLFCFCFAMFLLISGKPQFGYIYGVALLGSTSMYALLNLMSETGIDAYRTASVLGYCLLPMVAMGALSVGVKLDGMIGYILSLLSVAWCTHSASAIFCAVLTMHDQRFLVAYPVALLYGCFGLLTVFNVGGVTKS
ncbi:Yip1-domain-containing protein [Dacryopinax primogenitus]|uniref:Protein YIP n=1 Tax=Dacryopinax primogenitus (strain DJM 731) TaxID=1858805 RepID=M5G6X0_DACPD|nr:Yip1-domain-containing protein [Dacryopinax primogenitus]EJU04454.1 Yip1-domain-containing protein [Dacryopinax primogenitus]